MPSIGSAAAPVRAGGNKIRQVTIGNKAMVAMLALLILALGYWLWFGLTQKTINGDDGISIMASLNTIEHGYPLLPTGLIYDRGYVPGYMVAGAIIVFGLNDFSIMLPSLLMALGTLWLVYRLAKDVIGKPWVGVAAGILLISLQAETFYATSPRMYMALQFFTTLSVYSAWRGYVEGDGKFKLVAVLSAIAAMLSHREGVALVVAIPLSVLFVAWLTRPQITQIYTRWNLGALVLVGLIAFFVKEFTIPGGMSGTANASGDEAVRQILNIDPVRWAMHLLNLERAVPYVLWLMPTALILVVYSWLRKSLFLGHGNTYIILVFMISGSLLMLGTREVGFRLWLFALPLYALLICSTVTALIHWGSLKLKSQPRNILPSQAVLVSLLAVGIALNLGLVTLARGTDYASLVQQGYGIPCMNFKCHKSIEQHYAALGQLVQPGDVLVSSNAFVTQYYLGRVDGFLRARKDDEGNRVSSVTADDRLTNGHSGLPFVETKEHLQQLLADDAQVWIITDSKSEWTVSQETRDFIESMYYPVLKGEFITTYSKCMKPPCEPYQLSSTFEP